MHDPKTVAFQIKSPIRRRPSKLWPKGYRNTLVTIWHVDPDRAGDDDSCGWFKRARHGNPATLATIVKDFTFEWDSEHSGWFEPEGRPRYSSVAITLGMFRRAAQVHFGYKWNRTNRFLRRHLYDIVEFAENNTDSMHDNIVLWYGPEKREDRIESAAGIIYGCILRWTRPWYRHPRWHLHHWGIQVHGIQSFKRWAFSRCASCGKPFSWGYSPTTHTWDNGGPRWFRSERDVHHSECLGQGVAANTDGAA